MALGFVLISTEPGREREVYNELRSKYMQKKEESFRIPIPEIKEGEYNIPINIKLKNFVYGAVVDETSEIIWNLPNIEKDKVDLEIKVSLESNKIISDKILEINPLFGDYDYDLIAKIESKNFNLLGAFVEDKIKKIKGITGTKILTVPKF